MLPFRCVSSLALLDVFFGNMLLSLCLLIIGVVFHLSLPFALTTLLLLKFLFILLCCYMHYVQQVEEIKT